MQQVDEVVVRCWDHTAKRAIEATARAEAPHSTIGVDRASVAKALGGGAITISDAPVGDQEEADALAKSVMARIANAWLDAEGTCRGAPGLRAGSSVTIEGVGTRFSGTYRLTSTSHHFRGAAGYETRFRVSGDASRSLVELLTPATRPGWESGGVQVAVVTQNDDPDRLGRVRVKYPELGEETEGWWARMAGPGAGRDRGLLMTPLVGDEVLVAFEHGDVRRPVVLGALWNGEDTPGDLAGTEGAFRLRSGHEIGLVADKAMSITAQDELTVEVGAASSVMQNDGTISATGKDVDREGQRLGDDRGERQPHHQGRGEHHDPGRRHREGVRCPGAARLMGGILGSGLSFPLRVDARGGLALSHEDEDVREAMGVILGTAPGERPMRPEFGCGIHDYVFESVDAYLVGRLEQEVRRALDRWEPRIDVVSVDLSVEPGPGGGMVDEIVVIDVTYRLRATNDVRNLVHPFYVIPAEESTP